MLGSVNSSSHVSAIQLLNAAHAFKNTQAVSNPVQPQEPFATDGTDINDNDILKSQNVDEIKEYAKLAGEENLSEEDIKYGLSYGRSVIVEYLA